VNKVLLTPRLLKVKLKLILKSSTYRVSIAPAAEKHGRHVVEDKSEEQNTGDKLLNHFKKS
jgi:hypothetical protein